MLVVRSFGLLPSVWSLNPRCLDSKWAFNPTATRCAILHCLLSDGNRLFFSFLRTMAVEAVNAIFFLETLHFLARTSAKYATGASCLHTLWNPFSILFFPPLFCLGWLKASTCKRLPRGACCFCFTFRFYLCREKAGAVHILCFSHRCEWSRHRARLALCEEAFRCLVVQMVKVPRLRCIWFSFNRLWQWFTNFWLRTICGSRTVNTYHLGPVQ